MSRLGSANLVMTIRLLLLLMVMIAVLLLPARPADAQDGLAITAVTDRDCSTGERNP